MASFTSLPVELISRIGEFTDPFSHLDLACTCSLIAASMKDILKRHRAEYAKMPCSDLQPLTIPRLLRDVVADPVAAHHLQTINIWCNRSKWLEWRPFRLQAPPGPHEDCFEPEENSAAWAFRTGEVESYLNLLGEHLEDFEEGTELRELARDELARGDDGLLKALLILVCPRLRTVNFARTSYVPTDKPLDVGNTCLAWLCRIATSHRDQDIKLWPLGLQSLRNLAVGVETGTEFDGSIYQVYHPLFMAKILNLPNLESLYLYGVGYLGGYAEEDEQVATYPLTPGCSSVRHIYMEQLEDLGLGFWEHVAKACKNQLTSVAFRGGETHEIDAYVGSTREEAINLQSLMCYGPGLLTGYRCWLFHPVEALGGHNSNRNLRVFTVDISDLALEAGCNDGTLRQDFMDYLIGSADDPALPEAVEVLVLTGDFHYLAREIDGVPRMEEAAECFDEALAAMISDRRSDQQRRERTRRRGNANKEHADHGENSRHESGDTDDFASSQGLTDADEPWDEEDGDDWDGEYSINEEDDCHIFFYLKAVYIEPWEGRDTTAAMQSSSKLWLQKSIQAGSERGVDIRTRTNVNAPLHRDLTFHMAPDRFDLRPDLAPPENQEFDPLQGEWVDRGCRNCGDCEQCFALFPKELWTQAYRAPQEASDGDTADGDCPDSELHEGQVENEYREEIWTRIAKEVEPNSWELGYRVQLWDEYLRDRRCAGHDNMSIPDRGDPPIHLPETARGRAFLRTRDDE